MKTALRVFWWEHWFKMEYSFAAFLRERGIHVVDTDYSRKGYLDDCDVLIIGQNGLNDFIENDRDLIHRFIAGGGILWVMHQDWRRCNPVFLPVAAGRPLLVNRYCRTLNNPPSTTYLMPWPEGDGGKALFACPNRITMDEMVYWELNVNSFSPTGKQEPETVTTTALGALTDTEGWEVFGSFLDPAMPDDSALIMQRRYGKGLIFWSQILFPETREDPSGKVFPFWERFAENILEHFRRFTAGEPAPTLPAPPAPPDTPAWRRTITHLHSLDWFVADTCFAQLNAAMRDLGFDVAVIGFKDALSYHDAPNYAKYCDERVTILPGMEFHPFNFDRDDSHNAYHILAMGVSSCDNTFTRTLFDAADVDEYIRSALAHIKKHRGVSCATHPDDDYWRKYEFDAVDTYGFDHSRPEKGFKRFSGSIQERAWLEGSHITLMASVDMWGVARLKSNPVNNIIWYDGAPTVENFTAAVKAGHVIPGFGVSRADIRLGRYLPGDTVPPEERGRGISVRLSAPEPVNTVELYADDKLVASVTPPGDGRETDILIPTAGINCRRFLRIEVHGVSSCLIANPFFAE